VSVTVRPFAAGLGADISGVDIREPLSTADRDAIRAAWLANLVLRFRGRPTQEKFTWTQQWEVGDLVWWDNRCAMHRRDAFDPATRRLMHRTQLKGIRPV
jgi:alpha-ketoglutarate-dependent taurine dioxygenase